MNKITYEAALRQSMFEPDRERGYPLNIPDYLVYQESCHWLNKGETFSTMNGWAGCFGRHSRLDGCKLSYVYNIDWEEFK